MLGAAKLVQFWSLTAIWPPFIFFLVVPFVLFFVNLAGVKVHFILAFGYCPLFESSVDHDTNLCCDRCMDG